MRVVLATVGTRGDVQPMLALAQALARRGHAPLLACPDRFGAWVRGFGIGLARCPRGERDEAPRASSHTDIVQEVRTFG